MHTTMSAVLAAASGAGRSLDITIGQPMRGSHISWKTETQALGNKRKANEFTSRLRMPGCRAARAPHLDQPPAHLCGGGPSGRSSAASTIGW